MGGQGTRRSMERVLVEKYYETGRGVHDRHPTTIRRRTQVARPDPRSDRGSGSYARQMSRLFEELGRAPTPIGEISLRRRLEPVLQVDLFEIKIGEDGLMSSLITDGEEAVATLGLAASDRTDLDVVVGGLGLGHTAHTALRDDRVRSLVVVEALEPVIDWHRRRLTPLGGELSDDPRCSFLHADFFDLARTGVEPLDGRVDVLLLDVDHSPRHLLDPTNADFYGADGSARLAAALRPGGVFSLWSNDPPDDEYVSVLRSAFASVVAETVTFPNPLTGGETSSTVYVATRPMVDRPDGSAATATDVGPAG